MVWDIETGECCVEVNREHEQIRSISLRGDTIAWTTESHVYRQSTIDVRTGVSYEKQIDIGHTKLIREAPDGKRIATILSTARKAMVWEVETGRGQELNGPAGRIEELSWRPDGKWIAGTS
eukprot:450363-Hanusia_phi.AAC.1